jgi:ankyrin repeat protein
LEKAADVNVVNNIGISPLMLASHIGHLQVVELLLHASAAVNLKHDQGGTALLYASHGGQTKIAELLVRVPRYSAVSLILILSQ